MDASTFARTVNGLGEKSHPEKIKIFGWFLHTHRGKDRFSASDINACYDEANFGRPANMHRFFEILTGRKPPAFLKDAQGHRLSHLVRDRLDAELGMAPAALVVERILTDLPGKIADESERHFLVEALACYRAGALRAAIVMTWNLAFDHVARWVLSDPQRLAVFNAGIVKRNKAKANVSITTRDDFENLKEDEVIDILGNVPGITQGMKRTLKDKLGRRNTYAHPNTMKVERAQADDMITDLVNNVVLALPS